MLNEDSEIEYIDDEANNPHGIVKSETIKMLDEMKQHAVYMINPDQWYNIPICVVKAFKTIVEHC